MTAHADDPYRVFRPQFGLLSAWGTGLVVVGGCLVVGLVATGPLGSSWVNRGSLAVFALFAAWLLWRLGGVHAVPSPEGLRVRNVIYTRHLDWAQVVSVRFGRDDPWVRLDLADGSTLAVMGVQRADGARGEEEARRLAALVQAHGEAPDTAPGT
ncbi:PH domain-containing protein [Cellulosimicrobium marinum]|uniref:PH domain-containing protein n=1 Tax=Cellulosimicrobium marinum TaxID=1638992 RepID=UPI001E43E1D9|nr:PH domain-containing protein [Cellulosimicrobium marinum]MCB7137544.1 PH domain-containing protein [Cellulosimicrobium marinum]